MTILILRIIKVHVSRPHTSKVTGRCGGRNNKFAVEKKLTVVTSLSKINHQHLGRGYDLHKLWEDWYKCIIFCQHFADFWVNGSWGPLWISTLDIYNIYTAGQCITTVTMSDKWQPGPIQPGVALHCLPILSDQIFLQWSLNSKSLVESCFWYIDLMEVEQTRDMDIIGCFLPLTFSL